MGRSGRRAFQNGGNAEIKGDDEGRRRNIAFALGCLGRVEAYLLVALTLLDDLLDAVKSTSADEEYVLRVYLYKFLVRMLSSTLRGNVRYSTLEYF